jgi:osmotically inducible protein OsmC
MAIATRQAAVDWEGTFTDGSGTLSSGSGALERMPVSWKARSEQPDGKTSPEELIAAAHASCLAMALALVLGEAESPPGHLGVTARCTLDEVEGAPRITSLDLAVRAELGGLDQEHFERHLAKAWELCPVSNALRGGVKINVSGELEPVRAAA